MRSKGVVLTTVLFYYADKLLSGESLAAFEHHMFK